MWTILRVFLRKAINRETLLVFLLLLLGNIECNVLTRNRFWPTVLDCNCHQSCLFLSVCLSLSCLVAGEAHSSDRCISSIYTYMSRCPAVPLSVVYVPSLDKQKSRRHSHRHVSACGHSTFLHRFEISLLCEHTERSVLLILCQAQEDSILECYLLACGILASTNRRLGTTTT